MTRTHLDPDAMPSWLARTMNGQTFAQHVIAGINDDDCAVMTCDEGLLVITTDFLNAHPIAEELGISSPRTLGRLTVASSLSDLCGSGAQPKAILIATMMKRGSTTREFREFMRGAMKEAHRWKVPIVGGDTKLGNASAFLGIAIGTARSTRNLFLKNGARPGDILWCSGNLGSCCAAVLGIKRRDVTRSWRKWAISAITQPRLPVLKSVAVSKTGLGRGGIDISDGLGRDLCRLAWGSKVGVRLDLSKIPIAVPAQEIAGKLGIPSWSLPFGTGGDFQFLVTTGQRATRDMLQFGFHPIGEITASRQMTLKHADGRMARLPKEGHRDARGLSFVEEILSLLNEVCRAK